VYIYNSTIEPKSNELDLEQMIFQFVVVYKFDQMQVLSWTVYTLQSSQCPSFEKYIRLKSI